MLVWILWSLSASASPDDEAGDAPDVPELQQLPDDEGSADAPPVIPQLQDLPEGGTEVFERARAEEAEDEAEAAEDARDDEPYPVVWPGQCTPDQPHFDLEEIYHHKRFDEGLAECESRLAADPGDVDLLWMKARFLYEIGERFERDDPTVDKEAHYERMLATAERGLELDPGNLHHRFARGIAMGRLGTTRGVLSSLFMANDVEADWLAVANADWTYSSIGGEEVLPCDAYYALGIFYRLVPDWWIVKVLAGTKGDLSKSIAFHEKAVACKPHEIKVYKELGASQLCKGTHDKDNALIQAGRETLETGLSKKITYDRDRVDRRHIQMLLDDPRKACEYSRDGQQELDKDKLEQ